MQQQWKRKRDTHCGLHPYLLRNTAINLWDHGYPTWLWPRRSVCERCGNGWHKRDQAGSTGMGTSGTPSSKHRSTCVSGCVMNYKTLNHMAANWNTNESTHLMVVTLLMRVGAGGRGRSRRPRTEVERES